MTNDDENKHLRERIKNLEEFLETAKFQIAAKDDEIKDLREQVKNHVASLQEFHDILLGHGKHANVKADWGTIARKLATLAWGLVKEGAIKENEPT
jgi:chromosome segregation ATPase